MSNLNNTTLYIGVTNDIERRVKEHKSGTTIGFTQKYNCVKLVYYEKYSDIEQAIEREKKLKRWRREKKDWLISTMNPELKDLAEDFSTPFGCSKRHLVSVARNDKKVLTKNQETPSINKRTKHTKHRSKATTSPLSERGRERRSK